MIDDKKTDEAARKRLVAFRKANPDGYSSSIIDIESDCLNNFKDGAKWATNEFLKDLWHPISEEPEKNRICLVRVVYHLNHGMLPDEERIEQSSFHDFGWYDYDFKYIGIDYNIIGWLYVDDLFPKEGGEQ